jgi:hypothetical protein
MGPNLILMGIPAMLRGLSKAADGIYTATLLKKKVAEDVAAGGTGNLEIVEVAFTRSELKKLPVEAQKFFLDAMDAANALRGRGT